MCCILRATIKHQLPTNNLREVLPRSRQMINNLSVGMRMYSFLAIESNRDVGEVEGSTDTNTRPDLNCAFYAGLSTFGSPPYQQMHRSRFQWYTWQTKKLVLSEVN